MEIALIFHKIHRDLSLLLLLLKPWSSTGLVLSTILKIKISNWFKVSFRKEFGKRFFSKTVKIVIK